MVDPKSVVEGATALALLKTDLLKKLLEPVAEEFGKAFGDLASIYRFYQEKNLGKIFTKWAESRGDKPGLNLEDFEKVLPLIQMASVQSDDELQDRWAALLENTVNTTEGSLPSFGHTLSQLTPEEARFIDRLIVFCSKQYGTDEPLVKAGFSQHTLIRIYDPNINQSITVAEYEAHKEKKPGESTNLDKFNQAKLIIKDLERLGIIAQEYTAEFDRHARIGNYKVPIEGTKPILRSEYEFTEYGVSFIRVIKKPT
jgi:hypothetical protein